MSEKGKQIAFHVHVNNLTMTPKKATKKISQEGSKTNMYWDMMIK